MYRCIAEGQNVIKRVQIQNFKSLHDVTVDLGPFTVLVGKNGAGKSSFLQALQVLSWLVRHRSINDALDAHGLNYSELVHLKTSGSTMIWNLEVTVPDPASNENHVDASIQVVLAKRRHVRVVAEFVMPPESFDRPVGQPVSDNRFLLGRSGRRLMIAQENGHRIRYENVSLPHSILLDVAERSAEFPVLSAIAAELGGFMHYEIWGPEFLRKASVGNAAVLAERGENLPSVLHGLRAKRPEDFRGLIAELQQAYPWLDSIEFKRLGEGRFALSFLEKTTDKRKRRVRYQPSQVSDGFLRLLALTTLKYQTARPGIIGFEEPENGMHPGMLQEAVKRLRDIAAAGTQVIVTTHSPFLLQYVLSEESGGDPEKELRLVWRSEKDGRTVIRPPKKELLDKARKQGIGIGELWSMLLDESKMSAPPVPEPEGRR